MADNDDDTYPSSVDWIEDSDEEYLDFAAEILDLTWEDDDNANSPTTSNRRNPRIDPRAHQRLSQLAWRQGTLAVDMVVQVQRLPRDQMFAEFVRITMIYRRKHDGIVFLRGTPLTRIKYLQGIVEWYGTGSVFEVAKVLSIDRDDERSQEEQGAVEIPLANVKRIRRTIFTNAPYPEFVSDQSLICRWKYVRYFPNATFRRSCSPLKIEGEISTLRDDECQSEYVIDTFSLREVWRGGYVRGGEYIPEPGRSAREPIVLDDESPSLDGPFRKHGQKYTFCDTFCGAGGASRGATSAGLKVKYAIDNWDRACSTYRANFPDAELFQMDVTDYIHNEDFKHQSDILHLSPPCQYFSPAHTVANEERDKLNRSALFVCDMMVERIRPRFVTLEQTFGLLHDRFRVYFHSLLSSLTNHGYSVRWKIVHLPEWGLPALRKRLIVIGAGPGEKLAPFPEPTHSNDASSPLPRFVTVRKALEPITSRAHGNDPLHDLHEMPRINLPPWNPDKILPRCITTSGGQNYHYSGKRPLTKREFSLLQGFPMEHRFHAPCVTKQIGNAFPPVAAERLFRHLEDWLLQYDGISRELYAGSDESTTTSYTDVPTPDTIMIDGDNEIPVIVLDPEPLVSGVGHSSPKLEVVEPLVSNERRNACVPDIVDDAEQFGGQNRETGVIHINCEEHTEQDTGPATRLSYRAAW